MIATEYQLAVDCYKHMQPRQETRGRRLSSVAFWALPVPSWTPTAAAASNPSRAHAGARSRDTMERDRAGSEKPRPPDGTRFALGLATNEGRAAAERRNRTSELRKLVEPLHA